MHFNLVIVGRHEQTAQLFEGFVLIALYCQTVVCAAGQHAVDEAHLAAHGISGNDAVSDIHCVNHLWPDGDLIGLVGDDHLAEANLTAGVVEVHHHVGTSLVRGFSISAGCAACLTVTGKHLARTLSDEPFDEALIKLIELLSFNF